MPRRGDERTHVMTERSISQHEDAERHPVSAGCAPIAGDVHLPALRVGIVAHTADAYGAELALLELIDALCERGTVCCVVVPGRGRFTAALARRGVAHRTIVHRWWATEAAVARRAARGLANLAAAVRVSRCLVRWQVDVVLSNTAVIPTGALAARLARRPHVWSLHEIFAGPHALPFDLGRARTLRLIARLSDETVVCSEAVRREVAGFFPAERLCVVPPVFRPLPGPAALRERRADGIARVAVVGKLAANKGQLDAVDALARLVGAGRRVELRLIGDHRTSYADDVRRQAEARGVARAVVFAGYQAEPARALADADLVVGCARDESFGRVIAEAAALGRPVIAARTAATEELVEDGVTGWLYPIGDGAELARRIAHALDDRDVARRVAQAGSARVRRLVDPARAATRMLDVLTSAARSSPRWRTRVRLDEGR